MPTNQDGTLKKVRYWAETFRLVQKDCRITDRLNWWRTCLQALLSKWSSSVSVCRRSEPLLGRRKESVEIERKCIELLVPVVASEGSKFYPPWHPPVLLGLLNFQRVVEKYADNQPDGWRWQEYRIQEPIELQSAKVYGVNKRTCMWIARHNAILVEQTSYINRAFPNIWHPWFNQTTRCF